MRSNASPEYAAALLAACLLEAAWISLVYVTVERVAGQGQPSLSIVAFAVAALIGLGLARWSARAGRGAYRTPIAAFAVAVGLIGWLLPLGPAAVQQLVDEPAVVFGMHPAGILLGLAVLRGTAHLTPHDDERIAETAIGPGLAVVAGLWVLLTATGGATEPSVVGTASWATVAFVTAGLLSIGLARLADLRGIGVRDDDRRVWVGVLFGVVAGLVAIAVPIALILGVPLADAVRGIGGVVLWVVVAAAVLLSLPAAILGIAFVLVIAFLATIGGAGRTDPGDLFGGAVLDVQALLGPDNGNGLNLGVVPLIVAIVVAFVVVRMLVKRPGRSDVVGDLVEIREVERPIGLRFHRPRLPMPRRHAVPRTASEAYVASLEILARWPESTRIASETPAEHACRVRAHPIGPPLSRLAADYALVEFGRRILAPSEHRRAVERWRRLRAIDGQRPPPDA
jgi:hypothetical protein